MRRYGITLCLAVILIGVCVCSCKKETTTPPKAVKGVLDLSRWDFILNGPIELAGEFEFYWHKLLSPKDFYQNKVALEPGYILAPKAWNGFIYDGKAIQGEGYATYRLLVHIDPRFAELAVKTLEMSTAYTLFINGKKISSAGVVGETRQKAIPGYKPVIVGFDAGVKVLEIVVQVSNFSHRVGGAWETLTMGSMAQLQRQKERGIFLNIFLFGSVLIIGLYQLGIYSLRRYDWSALFFGLFCLTIALRLLITGERYILLIFPDLSYEFILKIEYLTFYLAVPFFLHYFYPLFSDRFSKLFLIVATIISFLFCVVVLVFPVRIISHTLSAYQIFTVVIFIYAIGILVMASLKKEIKAIIFLAGFGILFLSSINDMLYAQNIVQVNNMVPFGFFVFVFSQAYLLSRYFSDAFYTIEYQRKKLAENEQLLKKINSSLEKRVQERTAEILSANDELKREIEERKQAQKTMWKAKRAAEIASRAKSDFLANMSHELRTPMNHIIGFTELVIDQHFGKLNDVQKEYLSDVLGSAEHLLSLINDILDLSKVEAGKFVFRPKKIDIQPVLSGSFNMIKEKAMKKGIDTVYQTDDNLPDTIIADERMVKQILYNLLSNAVKFTPEGGNIKLSAKITNNYPSPARPSSDLADDVLRVSVHDTGIGLNKENVEMIFQPFEQVETSTSRRFQGTGLGLSLSRKFVELHSGSIWAESDGEGLGTTIFFTLPV